MIMIRTIITVVGIVIATRDDTYSLTLDSRELQLFPGTRFTSNGWENAFLEIDIIWMDGDSGRRHCSESL